MSHERFHFSPLQKAAPVPFSAEQKAFKLATSTPPSIAEAVFMILIFIISGIEKEIQICYSEATKGNQKAAYPKDNISVLQCNSRQLLGVVGGYFLLSSWI